MRVWKQSTDEHRTFRKTGSGRRKVTSARDDRQLLRMAVNDHTASTRQLAARWSTATGSHSGQSINGCVCNRLINTDPRGLLGNRLSFLMNPTLICGTMMAVFVLNTMSVNTAFQSALSNAIVTGH
ncbi:uncharacterized protein TNCV_2401651 [Trichonephila clavipes]|nr:uncharacterized protein TNCV_2401651 [Trichonephila clavipes]